MYKHHRFPAAIIQYAVCVYYRFNLSIRDIEYSLAQRTIIVDQRGQRTLIWETDEPIWLIVEEPVEQSTLPGEKLAARHWMLQSL